MKQAKQILMDSRDAGGDKALLYRVWIYLRDEADLAAARMQREDATMASYYLGGVR